MEEVLGREGEGMGEFAERGDRGGTVECLQICLREEGVVQERDVGVTAEDLGICFDDIVIDVSEEFVGG